MALVGYARVSSLDQSVDLQVDQLADAGCEKIFTEQKSGAGSQRPVLAECLSWVREGDVLICARLDRLSRSVLDLWKTVKALEAKGVGFRCLFQAVDTTTPEGRFSISVLGAAAELELDIKRARQAEGIARAKSAGKYRRARAVTKDDILKLKREGLGASEIGRRLKIDRVTVYRTAPGIWGASPIRGARNGRREADQEERTEP